MTVLFPLKLKSHFLKINASKVTSCQVNRLARAKYSIRYVMIFDQNKSKKFVSFVLYRLSKIFDKPRSQFSRKTTSPNHKKTLLLPNLVADIFYPHQSGLILVGFLAPNKQRSPLACGMCRCQI
jgi:hypothetical protein